jgi:hypothetical protein
MIPFHEWLLYPYRRPPYSFFEDGCQEDCPFALPLPRQPDNNCWRERVQSVQRKMGKKVHDQLRAAVHNVCASNMIGGDRRPHPFPIYLST